MMKVQLINLEYISFRERIKKRIYFLTRWDG